jgi:hypothetical protein
MPVEFKFSEQRQLRLYENLLLVGPGPAAFYKDACRLMDGPDTSFESVTHLVSHLCREMESALRVVLNSLVPKTIQASEKETKKSSTDSDNHARQIRAIAAWLGISETDARIAASLGLAKHAHRDALDHPRPITEDFLQWWDSFQAIFDALLQQFRKRFLEPFKHIDELLEKADPSSKDASRLRGEIPNNPVTLVHFFDNCQNSRWLPVLREQGFFANPPREGFWPQSRYLIRMAENESAIVAEIIKGVAVTENDLVREDCVSAALRMPAQITASLSEVFRNWTRSIGPFLAEKLGKAIAHLAAGGCGDAALPIATELLSTIGGIKEEDHQDHFLWQYERILKGDIPKLVAAIGLPALSALSEPLNSVAAAESSGQEGSNDFSSIWRPAIEDHEQNRLPGLASSLVTAVRDAAVEIVRSNAQKLDEVVGFLDAKGTQRRVFARIALHVLRVFADNAPKLVAQHAISEELFEDSQCQHEYSLLLRERFGLLSQEHQSLILGWIEAGGEPDGYKQESAFGVPTDERAITMARAWQSRRLAWIEPHLSPEWKSRYRELINTVGPSEHLECPIYTTEIIGSRSPKSAKDLEGIPISEIVAFLKSWHPSGQFMAASAGGLGEALSSAVGAAPERFATETAAFKETSPTYVRALVNGFSRSIRRFDWAPVLDLCNWVLKQSTEEIQTDSPPWVDYDPDWTASRNAVSGLVWMALSQNEVSIPFCYRQEVWSALVELSNDRDPKPEREAKFKGPAIELHNRAINSTRGQAIESTITYAVWAKKHLFGDAFSQEAKERGFKDVREVEELLEFHLDLNRDPSVAVRSIYGYRFPCLLELDKKWTVEHLAAIFPPAEQDRRFWEAAWMGYLGNPFSASLSELRAQYGMAIDRLSEPTVFEDPSARMDQSLATHLMSFYWNGMLSLDDPSFSTFWQKASSNTRGTALSTIGRWLSSPDGNVETSIIGRLVSLWEWRLEQAKASGQPNLYSDELASFGWWLAFRKFDAAWVLEQVQEVLALPGKIYLNQYGMERLAAIASERPTDAVKTLARLANSSQDCWRMAMYYPQQVRSVLAAAIRAGGDGSTTASDLINEIASRGQPQFRDLLPRPT